MKIRNAILIALIVVLIGFVSFAAYTSLVPSTGKDTTSTCPANFVCQPVGDIIIPAIQRSNGGGVSNLPLNISLGESTSLRVTLYLQVNSNVSAAFRLVAGPGGSSEINATFSPENLSCVANENASTLMTLHVSSSAPLGPYSAVVSFHDSSYTWGTNIQVNVQSG